MDVQKNEEITMLMFWCSQTYFSLLFKKF